MGVCDVCICALCCVCVVWGSYHNKDSDQIPKTVPWGVRVYTLGQCWWWWREPGYALDDAVPTSGMRLFPPILLELFLVFWCNFPAKELYFRFNSIFRWRRSWRNYLAGKKMQCSRPPTLPASWIHNCGVGRSQKNFDFIVIQVFGQNMVTKERWINIWLTFYLILTHRLLPSCRMMIWGEGTMDSFI